jgi:hypothetical protein
MESFSQSWDILDHVLLYNILCIMRISVKEEMPVDQTAGISGKI